MSDFEGHGWAVVPFMGTDSTNDTCGRSRASLHIGTLPGRKQVCLYGHNGTPGAIEVYAYFRTPEKARTALTILDRLMKP